MHACLLGNFGKRVVVIVVEQEVAAVEVGDVEVYVAVVVIIGGGDAFGEGNLVDVGSGGNVLKGSVSLIEEKLARPVFVADKKVEEAVVVDVRPNGSLGARGRLGQARFARDVGKGSVAIIPQERFTHGKFPGAAQNENVYAAVVVVIRLNHVQAAELVGKTRLRRAVDKCSVAIIVKEPQRLAHVVAGHRDVQETVVLEIIRNHAAGHGNEI